MIGNHKTAMLPDAPWGDRNQTKRRAKGLETMVVYVFSDAKSGYCKIGHTFSLKKRIGGLMRQLGTELQIVYWIEVTKKDALRVERKAQKLLRLAGFKPIRGREWFEVSEALASHSVRLSARAVGANVISTAGMPWALDPSKSEIAEVLAEPIAEMAKNGRLDREIWAPQGRG